MRLMCLSVNGAQGDVIGPSQGAGSERLDRGGEGCRGGALQSAPIAGSGFYMQDCLFPFPSSNPVSLHSFPSELVQRACYFCPPPSLSLEAATVWLPAATRDKVRLQEKPL